MDLSEIRAEASVRHPWEVARASAVVRVLAGTARSFDAVLDYGCGDGYAGREVQRALGASTLVGVDVHLPQASCGISHYSGRIVELTRDEATLGSRRFDLILLCDVIEHVEDAEGFVQSIVERRSAQGAHWLVTAPAFQALFSNHDRALKHFRRYSLAGLRRTLKRAGLELIDGGYLFASLLAPRALGKLAEIVKRPTLDSEFGIGAWHGGPRLTRLVTRGLAVDNALLLGARHLGLTLPGLSAWALCKTP